MDFDITDIAPEHKSGGAVRGGYDDFRVTFEEFKVANDERLARLEQKRGDALLEEKVDRINARSTPSTGAWMNGRSRAPAPTMSRNFLKSYSRVLVNIGRVTTTIISSSRRGPNGSASRAAR
jgi:hypothetical protein